MRPRRLALERRPAASGDTALLVELQHQYRISEAQLLARVEPASPTRRRALLRQLIRVELANGARMRLQSHAFFHVIWPLTWDPDESIAVLAIAACASNERAQTRWRFTTQFQQAMVQEDYARQRLLLLGLVGCSYAIDLATPVLHSKSEATREAALAVFEQKQMGFRDVELDGLREAAAHESNPALHERLAALIRAIEHPPEDDDEVFN